jgi:hypothetical protein
MDALVAHVTFDPDGNRLQLPKHLSDRLVWLTGSETIAAWIWAVSPGRYRLLSDEQVQLESNLDILRSIIVTQQLTPSAGPTVAKNNNEAAVVATLIPTQLKFQRSYWRLSFPDVLEEFIPLGCDEKKLSFLVSIEGYLEIWYTHTLREGRCWF